MTGTLLALSWSAQAEDPPASKPETRGYVEVGGNYFAVTSGYRDWNGLYLKGVFRQGHRNVWNAELLNQRAFGDNGTYGSLGLSHSFNRDWYGSVAVGAGSGRFFFPRFRADAFLNKKWLKRRNLVTTVGGGYYAAKDPHRDYSLFVGAAYHFQTPWIVEGGVRWNTSNPGSVVSQSGFLAVTRGRERNQYLIVRAGFGREAYQLIGPSAPLADFPSQSVSVTWRKWVQNDWGFNLRSEYYANPFYKRPGVALGIFKEF